LRKYIIKKLYTSGVDAGETKPIRGAKGGKAKEKNLEGEEIEQGTDSSTTLYKSSC
jgi:hypothetical protein